MRYSPDDSPIAVANHQLSVADQTPLERLAGFWVALQHQALLECSANYLRVFLARHHLQILEGWVGEPHQHSTRLGMPSGAGGLLGLGGRAIPRSHY